MDQQPPLHQVLHIAILVSTLLGAAGVAIYVFWPILFEDPMPAPARNGLLGIVFVAVILLLVEWRIVH
jgi:hypothetical protein